MSGRSSRSAAAVAVLAGLVAGLAGAPAAVADDCANAEFRTGPSAQLPDCRAYEMVSPADKSGYGLQQTRTTGSLSYLSLGGDQAFFALATPFADPISGNVGMFVSRRTAAGWTTRNITPDFCDPDPSGIVGYMTISGLARDFSAAVLNAPRSNCDPDDHAGGDVYLRPVEGNQLIWLSHNNGPKTVDQPGNFAGHNADLSHVVFSTVEKLVLPLEASRTGAGLYDRTGGQAIPVGLDDAGNPINNCGVQAAAGHDGTSSIVSADGRVIVFRSGQSASVPGCSPVTDDGGQLYARVDHEQTVLLSDSRLAVPETRQAPTFMGATDDGSRMFFKTDERLTEDATAGGGLYVYDLSDVLSGASDEGELRFLTPSANGLPAVVTGSNLVAFGEDGGRLYFIAKGVLTPDAPAGANPPKLYTVGLGSGEVTYLGPWTGATIDTTGTGTASPDGSKFAFLDLVGGVRQIKLYDAAEDSLTCVSCPGGGPQVGDARLVGRAGGERPARIAPRRHVTDDGRVFFNSLDQLVPADGNSMYDVYEYADGEHKLLSSGNSAYDSLLFGVSPDGRDVLMTTHDGLVPADNDNGDQDLYVARVGGGFPPPAAGGGAGCSGDACQGGSPTAPAGGSAGSAGFRSAGNATTPKVARVSLAAARRSVRGRAAWLRFRVSDAGRVAVSGRGIARSAKRVGRAGQHKVRVRLSKAGRRALARRGRLAVRVTVRLRAADGQVRQARGRIVFRAPLGRTGGR